MLLFSVFLHWLGKSFFFTSGEFLSILKENTIFVALFVVILEVDFVVFVVAAVDSQNHRIANLTIG